MTIPHSGNECSGMCRPPCGHNGCWQCVKIVEVEAEKVVQQAQRRAQKALNTLSAKPVKPAMASFSGHQTATITRNALEALCERAGLEMVWNGGDPIINDQKQMMKRRLNDIGPDPLAQAAAHIAAGASTTMDKIVADALKGPTPEVLRIQGIPGLHKQVNGMTAMREEVERIAKIRAEAQEQEAREVLKAQGASDEDIAAAKALFDWDPDPKPQQFITADPTEKIDISTIINAWRPRWSSEK